MYCENCGSLLNDGAKFCANCGASIAPQTTHEVDQPQPSDPSSQIELTDRIQLCPDGKYRLNYELNLVKNLSVFIDLIKVFGFILLGMWLITELVQIIKGDFEWDGFLIDTKVFFLDIRFHILSLPRQLSRRRPHQQKILPSVVCHGRGQRYPLSEG